MSGILRDNIDVSDIPIDTSNADVFINYFIPIKLLHNLILIYLFHVKSHLSLKFFIASNIILVIAGYLFFGIPIDVFYIIPIWFLISFITIKEKIKNESRMFFKKLFIHKSNMAFGNKNH